VNKVNFNDLKNNFTISDNIGEFKIEKNKKLTNTKLEIIQNELITFPDFKPIIKTFNDEYNTEAINQYIEKNRVVFIKGIYPGTGKSQAVKNYDKDTLFIVPYNELGLQMMTEGYKTATFNSFFGLDLTDTERTNKVKFASQSLGRQWKMRQEKLSPRYTTSLSEIIQIKL
jgi:superfamily II DNA or RNA helicase